MDAHLDTVILAIDPAVTVRVATIQQHLHASRVASFVLLEHLRVQYGPVPIAYQELLLTCKVYLMPCFCFC